MRLTTWAIALRLEVHYGPLRSPGITWLSTEWANRSTVLWTSVLWANVLWTNVLWIAVLWIAVLWIAVLSARIANPGRRFLVTWGSFERLLMSERLEVHSDDRKRLSAMRAHSIRETRVSLKFGKEQLSFCCYHKLFIAESLLFSNCSQSFGLPVHSDYQSLIQWLCIQWRDFVLWLKRQENFTR